MGVVGPPETECKYSNVALGLAGYIVEAASGEPYPEYVARHILAPLGMTGTRVIPTRDMSTLAVGYGRRVAGKPRRLEPFFNGNYMLAASNFASTVEDLAKYASLQFRRDPAEGVADPEGLDARRDAARPMAPAGLAERPGARLEHRPARRRDPQSATAAPFPGIARRSRSSRAEVRGHRADERGGRERPSLYVNQAYAIVAPAIAKAAAARRRSRRRIPRGASTRASTSGRTRRSTSPFSTEGSRSSTPPKTIPGTRG